MFSAFSALTSGLEGINDALAKASQEIEKAADSALGFGGNREGEGGGQ